VHRLKPAKALLLALDRLEC